MFSTTSSHIALRSDNKAYLDFQYNAAKEKINDEVEVLNDSKYSNSLIIADRSVLDNLFYCTFYIDKSNFHDSEARKYINLLMKLMKLIKHAEKDLYYKIILFSPIEKIDFDNGFRTSKLPIYQSIEDIMIKQLTHCYINRSKIVELKTSEIDYFIENIHSL